MKNFRLRLVPQETNIDFMGIKKINFVISILLMLIAIGAIIFKSFNYGIDFTGGTIIEAQLDEKPNIKKVRDLLAKLDVGEIQVQEFGKSNIMIKIGSKKDQITINRNEIINSVKEKLTSEFSNIEYQKIDYVGPQVGDEMIKKGLTSVILAFIAIMVYVAFRFEWQYGISILLALIHDTIVTLGFISLTNIEFDLTSVAAILTIIGYSVNDSVVIYDRIRKNFKKFKNKEVDAIINLSINETLSRTVLTVVTTLLAVISLIIFGGKNLFSFSIVVFVGIIIGTYSSVYISAPILINLGIKNYTRK